MFNVPWYYKTISIDIGGAKGRYYRYKNIIGVPDAVFKHCLLPIYIVGELKGRSVINEHMRQYEFGQLMLYIGMLKNIHWLSSVKGRLAYKNSIIYVNFDPVIFKDITSKKKNALKILNRFH